jgi:hypothetical protein
MVRAKGSRLRLLLVPAVILAGGSVITCLERIPFYFQLCSTDAECTLYPTTVCENGEYCTCPNDGDEFCVVYNACVPIDDCIRDATVLDCAVEDAGGDGDADGG